MEATLTSNNLTYNILHIISGYAMLEFLEKTLLIDVDILGLLLIITKRLLFCYYYKIVVTKCLDFKKRIDLVLPDQEILALFPALAQCPLNLSKHSC